MKSTSNSTNQVTLSGKNAIIGKKHKKNNTEGYLEDFISKQWVKDTPEERDAVQVFSHKLVEEYGYPKSLITTRPQFRVRISPSGQPKYPVDIAVFTAPSKQYSEAYILVECKRPNRKEGRIQLEEYLNLCPSAQIGVWFNGNEHLYVRRIQDKNGVYKFPELPQLPKHLQQISSIGHIRRKDLSVPINLKATFRDIRNHLAGMTTGMTLDVQFAKEVINILFCKIFDELNKGPEEFVDFHADPDEPPPSVKKNIVSLFENVVKKEYDDVFDRTDTITLDAESLTYVVGELQNYVITEADREAIGDAFEVFIGPALRGSEGQFFTPRNVVKMMIDILNPQPKEMIIDPACGSGGFLISGLEHVWKSVEKEGKEKAWTAVHIQTVKTEVANKYFRGLDKDSFLAKVTKAYMAIVGDGRGGVFCENSLVDPNDGWDPKTKGKIELGLFDVVVTNPPFGTKIQVKGSPILKQYDLGHIWEYDKEDSMWFKQESELHDSQPPQILFLERCLQFLKVGGRLGIILPESLFGMPTYHYFVQWLRNTAKIVGIISMPEELFQPHTHAKVCIVFIEKTTPAQDYLIYMDEAEWCGHDSRGNPTIRTMKDGSKVLLDDIPDIPKRFREKVKWT